MRISAAGAPLAVLSNRSAYCFHRGMRCWMCLADSSFPASAFASVLAPSAASAGAPAANAAGPANKQGLQSGTVSCIGARFEMMKVLSLHFNSFKLV